MAHGVLREFDPVKESIEDLREHFDFYCLANNIRGNGKAATQWKQAPSSYPSWPGTFAKLKTLASPTPVNELLFDRIMEHLILHYKPQAIEIAERFKFFKRHQLGGESTIEFGKDWLKLVTLAITWKQQSGINLHVDWETLYIARTQQELLCILGLTVQTAFAKCVRQRLL